MFNRRRRRRTLWCGLGFLIVQAGLTVGLETRWANIRDPELDFVQQLIAARRAEAPRRPLFLAVGSSRTLFCFNAARLSQSSNPTAPLVINAAIKGSGPMLQQITLKRLVAAGQSPARVFLEVMPMSLSTRDGPPIEERQKFTARYTAAEVAYLLRYYALASRLLVPWLHARLLPVDRRQAELHFALGIDVAPDQVLYREGRDDYGWCPVPDYSPGEVEAVTRDMVERYRTALAQPTVAPGPVRALRDTLRYCQKRHIAVDLLVPPEASAFRRCAPEVAQIHMNVIRGLAQEAGVPLIDARCWIDDDGFSDGHHATVKGANQFTDRFAREVLAPHRSRKPPLP
jgi:hypothetical protein